MFLSELSFVFYFLQKNVSDMEIILQWEIFLLIQNNMFIEENLKNTQKNKYFFKKINMHTVQDTLLAFSVYFL